MSLLANQVVLVTGGTAGLGTASVRHLAGMGPQALFFTGRSKLAGNTIAAELQHAYPKVKIAFLELDLACMASIKRFAALFAQLVPRLDVLMLNAGVAFAGAGLSSDGYEVHFATNHLGHALLTQLLLPLLLPPSDAATLPPTTALPRVVVVTSEGHRLPGLSAPLYDLDLFKTPLAHWSSFARYCVSKLVNVQFARGLAARYPQLRVSSVHPGMVYTDIAVRYLPFAVPLWMQRLGETFFARPASEGAKTQVWCCHAGTVQSGAYYTDIAKPSAPSALAADDKLAAALWEWTDAELTRQGGPGWVLA